MGGNNDVIFGPLKAAAQAGCGEKAEARETMATFNETHPVVLGVRGCYHMCQPGEFERGKELGKRGWDVTLVIVGETVNSIPIIGHVKGLYHYARQVSAAGDSAMKSSSRTTAGVIGAVAGLVVGHVPGAVAGYMSGVTAGDGIISGVDSAIHGEKKLYGNLATCEAAYLEPSVSNVFDASLGIGLDVWTGADLGSIGGHFHHSHGAGAGGASSDGDTTLPGLDTSGDGEGVIVPST